MTQQMLPKFEKYWDSYGLVLSIAIVLDPCFKLHFVKYCYTKIDKMTCHEKIMKVKVAMENLFQAYASQNSVHSTQQTSKATFVPDTNDHSFSNETLDFENY